MIRTWAPDGSGGLAEVAECAAGALWVDLSEPEPDELDRVGRAVGIPLPSREDMEEIELSSRLYREHGTDFLTLVLPALSETEQHEVAPVTFALGDEAAGDDPLPRPAALQDLSGARGAQPLWLPARRRTSCSGCWTPSSTGLPTFSS